MHPRNRDIFGFISSVSYSNRGHLFFFSTILHTKYYTSPARGVHTAPRQLRSAAVAQKRLTKKKKKKRHHTQWRTAMKGPKTAAIRSLYTFMLYCQLIHLLYSVLYMHTNISFMHTFYAYTGISYAYIHIFYTYISCIHTYICTYIYLIHTYICT